MVDRSRRGEQESLEVMRDRLRAWWTTVLAGQVDQSYPVLGSDVTATLDEDTLVITGSVPTEDDLDALRHELEHLRGGVRHVRNEVTVKREAEDEEGLLAQTLVGVFENDEQAGFAEGYLEGHAHLDRGRMKVVAPENAGEGHAVIHALLPESYWEDVDRALDADRSLLIVTVDETEAFRVRQLLDEETRSLQTIVLPPVRADGPEATRATARLPRGVEAAGGVQERSEGGRRAAMRRQEDARGS